MSSLWKLLILGSLKGSELGMTMLVRFWSVLLSKMFAEGTLLDSTEFC